VDGRDKPGYDGGTLQGPSSRVVVTEVWYSRSSSQVARRKWLPATSLHA
jgi:hypothetical protein